MKALTVIGTIAMFLVGGGILLHGIPSLAGMVHHFTDQLTHFAGSMLAPVLEVVVPTMFDAVAGVVAGGLVYLGVQLFEKLKSTKA